MPNREKIPVKEQFLTVRGLVKIIPGEPSEKLLSATNFFHLKVALLFNGVIGETIEKS